MLVLWWSLLMRFLSMSHAVLCLVLCISPRVPGAVAHVTRPRVSVLPCDGVEVPQAWNNTVLTYTVLTSSPTQQAAYFCAIFHCGHHHCRSHMLNLLSCITRLTFD